jgi:hypothetical protein
MASRLRWLTPGQETALVGTRARGLGVSTTISGRFHGSREYLKDARPRRRRSPLPAPASARSSPMLLRSLVAPPRNCCRKGLISSKPGGCCTSACRATSPRSSDAFTERRRRRGKPGCHASRSGCASRALSGSRSATGRRGVHGRAGIRVSGARSRPDGDASPACPAAHRSLPR